MKEPVNTVTVAINGIGELRRRHLAAGRRQVSIPDLEFVAKRCDECRERGRRLPPAGVIEIVAGKGRAPLLQNSLEPSGLDVNRHLIVVDIGEPLAGQGRLADQAAVVEWGGATAA